MPPKFMKTHWSYLKYVVRHKFFVYQAGVVLGVPIWRLLKHDWHKFLPSEWVPYAAYFYCPKVKALLSEPDDFRYWHSAGPAYREAFNRAWNLHQKRADHHWQHWLLTMDSGDYVVLKMSEPAALEMIADWLGAGRAITGGWEAEAWYEKNKGRIRLHHETREFVESKLKWFGATLRRAAQLGITL